MGNPATPDTPLPGLIRVDDLDPYERCDVDGEFSAEETALFDYARVEFAEPGEVDAAVDAFAVGLVDAQRSPTSCGLCGDETIDGDRLPFGPDGVVHWRCVALLAVEAQGRKMVVLAERRGPWMETGK